MKTHYFPYFRSILFVALLTSVPAYAQVPVPKFGAPIRVVEQYESLQLFDSSTNNPTAWEWDIYDSVTYASSGYYPGLSGAEVYSDPWGNGNNEFSKNPEFAFDVPGVYTVTLRCRNASGWSAKLVKKGYIKVQMPTMYSLGYGTYGTNNDNIVDSDVGTIYDDGGDHLNYSNGMGKSKYSFLLVRPCRALSITLTMSQLKFADVNDVLYVYDAEKEDNSKLLAAWTKGNTSGKTVTAYSGSMYIIFKSDLSGVDSGFAGSYTSVLDTSKNTGVVDFDGDSIGYNSTPLKFISTSVFPGSPACEWTIDNNQVPQNNKRTFGYTFYTDGKYKVCLRVRACDEDKKKCDSVKIVTAARKTSLDFKASSTYSTKYDKVVLTPKVDNANRFEWTISPSSYTLLNPPGAPSVYTPGHIYYHATPGDSFPTPVIQLQDTVSYTVKLKAYNSLDPTATQDSLTKTSYIWGKDFRTVYGLYGNIYHDLNSDCQRTSGDYLLKNIPINLYDTANRLVDKTYPLKDGTFLFDKTSGKYRIALDIAGLPVKANCPVGVDTLVQFSKSSPFGGIDFPLECQGKMDIGIQSVFTMGRMFPGRQYSIYIKAGILNKWFGMNCVNSTIAGSMKVDVQGKTKYSGAPKLSFATSSASGNTITYSISDLNAIGEYDYFVMNFRMDTSAKITDSIEVDIEMLPTTNDADTLNNRVHRTLLVINSHDPNIKEVYPARVQTGYSDWLTYTIHFQNTGNAPAYNIRLEDTLDAQLDPGTFHIIEQSHNNRISLKGNILKVYFDDIMLPDSHSNPEGSIGFIQYKVKPKTGLADKAVVKNTAYIYFDYNTPVATNTAVTESNTPPSNGLGRVSDMGLSVYPNPGTGFFNVVNPSKDAEYGLFDPLGKCIQNGRLMNGLSQLDMRAFDAGVYFLKVRCDGLSYTIKLIKY